MNIYSIVVAAISQWHRRLSACVMAHGFIPFCGIFMVQCVKLMLNKYLHLWLILFDYFVCRQTVGLTCLKRFTRGEFKMKVELFS